MKTYEEWLEIFKEKIKEGYEHNRMDKRLCEFAHEVERPARTLLKYDRPFSAQTISEGQGMNIITMDSPKRRTVEPLQVGIRIDGLRSQSFENDGWGLESLVFRWGSMVAENEYRAIVKGMSDNAGKTIKAKKKGEVTELDIREAKSWIGQNGRAYADTIVMPIKQETDLLVKGELWLPHKIPSGYVPEKDRGPYYAGWFGGTNVYWMRFFKDFVLVFAKRWSTISNTPMEIYYDNPRRPSQLFIFKKCSSAPMLEQAVVKITL